MDQLPSSSLHPLPSLRDTTRSARDGSPELARAFQELAERFCRFARRYDIEIRPFEGDHPVQFYSLSPDDRRLVYERFAHYVRVTEELVEDGGSPDDDLQMVWRYLRHLRVRPTSDLFSRVRPTDFIEIYQVPQMVQVFRSFRFFRLCGYSLDDLLCRPWWQLYRRDAAITGRLQKRIDEILSQRVPRTVTLDTGVHNLVERHSSTRNRVQLDSVYGSPLVDRRQNVVAIIGVVRVHSVVRTVGSDAGRELYDPSTLL